MSTPENQNLDLTPGQEEFAQDIVARVDRALQSFQVSINKAFAPMFETLDQIHADLGSMQTTMAAMREDVREIAEDTHVISHSLSRTNNRPEAVHHFRASALPQPLRQPSPFGRCPTWEEFSGKPRSPMAQ